MMLKKQQLGLPTPFKHSEGVWYLAHISENYLLSIEIVEKLQLRNVHTQLLIVSNSMYVIITKTI